VGLNFWFSAWKNLRNNISASKYNLTATIITNRQKTRVWRPQAVDINNQLHHVHCLIVKLALCSSIDVCALFTQRAHHARTRHMMSLCVRFHQSPCGAVALRTDVANLSLIGRVWISFDFHIHNHHHHQIAVHWQLNRTYQRAWSLGLEVQITISHY